MTDALDLTTTPFILPADIGLLPVNELSPRLRAKLGPVDDTAYVVTRPGFRVTNRLVPASLAALLSEFRAPSLLTDAVLRFSRTQDQNAEDMLDLTFEALTTCISGRFLVAACAGEAMDLPPSLGPGQVFAGFEVERLVRSLDDTEVYRGLAPDGQSVAIKLARDARAAPVLALEAEILLRLDPGDSPRLIGQGIDGDRSWLALDWRDGVPVSVAAQMARASGDRGRLRRLVAAVLDAYARLHARGVLHGDIHPGNVLVDDAGRVTILDFGQARLSGRAKRFDLSRTGIAHFYDPQLADAIDRGQLTPAATQKSEQFALATLTYLLLTGTYPMRVSADKATLLTNIANHPMLAFATQGVDAWPQAEAVLRRALSKLPQDRFAETVDFARAFRAARLPTKPVVQAATDQLIETLRTADALPDASPVDMAWICLRGAIIRSDPDLLAVASLWADRAGHGLDACAVAAQLAQTRSDRTAEAEAVAAFCLAIGAEADMNHLCRALGQAAMILRGAVAQNLDTTALIATARLGLDRLEDNGSPEPVLQATLALQQAGVLAPDPTLFHRLDALKGGSVWLWSLAHDLLHSPRYRNRALAARLPDDPAHRGFACLRLHQLTGQMHWIKAARQAGQDAASAGKSLESRLLALELCAPSRFVQPPLQRPRWTG